MKGKKCHTLLLARERKYDKLKMRAGKDPIPFSVNLRWRQAHLARTGCSAWSSDREGPGEEQWAAV